jgi:uncharacterized NAD(P)/FAD-binding protein YdhS
VSTAARQVVVVGGGFSGTLAAARLLAGCGDPQSVTILEPRDALGRGVAYSTTDDRHLLNVPAAEISALPERPTDFVEWLRSTGNTAGQGAYLPRSLYGRYVGDLLTRAVAAAPRGSRVAWRQKRAVSLRQDRSVAGRLVVGLAGGGHLRADHVVLAVGAPSPHLGVPFVDELAALPGFVADPWALGALDRVGRGGGDVLLIGTGLTMVDAVLTLSSAGRRPGVLHARSRHGLWPNAHLPWTGQTTPALAIEPDVSARRLFKEIRLAVAAAVADGATWQDAVDSVRWLSPALWDGLPEAERRRVLRHAFRPWQVAVHRTAPAVGAELRRIWSSGGLTVGQGRAISARYADGTIEVTLVAANRIEVVRARSVVNCSGPSNDLRRIPLLRVGMESGLFRPDATGFGMDIDLAGHPVGVDGTPAKNVSVIGWLRRGALFESAAVRDLRVQALTLCGALGTDRSLPPVAPGGVAVGRPSVVASGVRG